MYFSKKKLPIEAAENLRECPIGTVDPYALMLAPVYLFMRENQKFVSIKGPLDFFTPEEITKLKPFESFFFPKFVESALYYRRCARQIRGILGWIPKIKIAKTIEVALSPPPYEISDSVLRILGTLWSKRENVLSIEPFFISIFSSELCETLPAPVLTHARDLDVDKFERSVLLSSWAVFAALHLGYCDLGYLNRLRSNVFSGQFDKISSEIQELVVAFEENCLNQEKPVLYSTFFNETGSIPFLKFKSRLDRIVSELQLGERRELSIYGPEGFVDA